MTMLRVLLLVVALCGMAACVLAPIFYFFGRIDVNTYQDSFLAGSVIWFLRDLVGRQGETEDCLWLNGLFHKFGGHI